MTPISQSVPSFLQALQAGDAIGITTDGKWYHKGIIRRIIDVIKGFFCGYDAKLENAKNFSVSLSSLTKLSVEGVGYLRQSTTWDPTQLSVAIQAVKATIQGNVDKEEQQIRGLISQRDALQASLNPTSPITQIAELNRKIYGPESWANRLAAANLDRANLMHRYLGEDQRKIDFTIIKQEDAAWLEKELRGWQKRQFPHVEYLIEEENELLQRSISRYRTIDEFIDELKDSIPLLNTCCQTDFQEGSPEISAFLSKSENIRHIRAIFNKWKKFECTQAKLHRCCCYQEFISAARNNRALLDMCFQSVFKSMPDECTNAIDLFIQAPQIQEKLRKTFLDKRIREVANNGLRFGQYTPDYQGKPLKSVQLLIDGECQSITDEKDVVRLAQNVSKTVSEVFEELEAQNARFINIEYLQEKGLTAFDGRLLNCNLDKEEWWKDLPVIRRLTREQIEDIYDVDFKEGYALFALRASRTTPDLNGDGNHGWADLLVPLADGTFNCLSLGKFSNWFPVTFMETFTHVFHTHEANVTIVDPNSFMSSRDRISVALPPINENQFKEIMQDLRNELLLSRKGDLIFQAQGDNCASWIRHFVQRNWKGLDIEPYQTRFEDIILPSLLMPVIWARNIFPNDDAWHWFRRSFCWLFGAGTYHEMPDGRHVRLLDNQDWNDGILQIPARLWIEKQRILNRIHQYMEGQKAALQFQGIVTPDERVVI
jgi:hypothetical protein